jgi:hypothetical protein
VRRWSFRFELSFGQEEPDDAEVGVEDLGSANLSGSVLTCAVDDVDGYHSLTDHGNGEDEFVDQIVVARRMMRANEAPYRGRIGFKSTNNKEP